MAKIMIQGTASSVGKSILVTAICRILTQDGFKVCPYKSQNMSLNSYITLDGKEMGRAQVLQAYACNMEPEAYMNPILLKPTGNKNSQVIVNGEVYGNFTAMEYHNLKPKFSDMLKEDFKKLEDEFDIVVIEGAGSPAEINLRDKDIVNMGLAELVDAPVVLVGDIDKGGVFASLAGTILLLKDDEKARVKGTIINKFRGDVEILKPGLKMIEDIILKPTLGVVPYFKLDLEDEDGAIEFNKKIIGDRNKVIDIAVIKLPHISNFTDLDALKIEDSVSVRFVTTVSELENPDLLIIPGSKNTIEDLLYLRKSGIEAAIKAYEKLEDSLIIGICGGFQMLGQSIEDPYGVESGLYTEGMSLLNISTVFEKEKSMTRVQGVTYNDLNVYGYEIHMGICKYNEDTKEFLKVTLKNGNDVSYRDGATNKKGNVIGTYIHGIFDSIEFREYILNNLRAKKGLSYKKSKNYESIRERELNKLADIVRNSIDMKKIYEIMGLDI
jgi:adenosylcobyric acid synthase